MPGCAPFDVTFSNTSTGAGSYVWDFGDGSTSAAVSPTHTFVNTTFFLNLVTVCLLYTSDAADARSSVALGGRRIIKKKKTSMVAVPLIKKTQKRGREKKRTTTINTHKTKQTMSRPHDREISVTNYTTEIK